MIRALFMVLMLLVILSAFLAIVVSVVQTAAESRQERSVFRFFRDPVTDLCFADARGYAGSMTYVPCTPKVLEAIGR